MVLCMSKYRSRIIKFKDMNYDVTWDEYQKMSDSDRVPVFEYLYNFFNEQALALDVPQILVYENVKAHLIRHQRYEFCAILRDFKHYYGESF